MTKSKQEMLAQRQKEKMDSLCESSQNILMKYPTSTTAQAKPTPTREEQFAIDKKRVIELQTKQLQGLIFTTLELEELLSIRRRYTRNSDVKQESELRDYTLTLESRNRGFKEGKGIYADGRHIYPQVCGSSIGQMSGLIILDLEANAALIGIPLITALPIYSQAVIILLRYF